MNEPVAAACRDLAKEMQPDPAFDKAFDEKLAAQQNARSVQIGGDHYAKFKIQPVDFIEMNNLGYSVGNIIKYVVRYKAKNGVQDLRKARHYIDMLIEQETAQ